MVTRFIGLGSTLALARLLVPADFGLLGMATAFSGSIDALSTLGLQDALVRRRAEGNEIYDTAFTLQLIRAVLTSAILLVFAAPVAAWFKEPRLIQVLIVFAAASLISGLENIGIVQYRRELRFDVQFKLLLWPRLIWFRHYNPRVPSQKLLGAPLGSDRDQGVQNSADVHLPSAPPKTSDSGAGKNSQAFHSGHGLQDSHPYFGIGPTLLL